MKKNNSGEVICADNPRTLMQGWIDKNTGQFWQINIEHFRQSSYFMGEENAKKLRANIGCNASMENRAKILELLDDLRILERLCKLKAFW